VLSTSIPRPIIGVAEIPWRPRLDQPAAARARRL